MLPGAIERRPTRAPPTTQVAKNLLVTETKVVETGARAKTLQLAQLMQFVTTAFRWWLASGFSSPPFRTWCGARKDHREPMAAEPLGRASLSALPRFTSRVAALIDPFPPLLSPRRGVIQRRRETLDHLRFKHRRKRTKHG